MKTNIAKAVTINQILANKTMDDMIILDSNKFHKLKSKNNYVDKTNSTFVDRYLKTKTRFIKEDYENITDSNPGYWLFLVSKCGAGYYPEQILIYVQPLCFVSKQKDSNYMKSLLFLRKHGRLFNLRRLGCEPKISDNQFESAIMDFNIILDSDISRSVEFYSLCTAYEYFRFFNLYPLELNLMNTKRIEDSMVYPKHFNDPYDFMCAMLYDRQFDFSITDILALLKTRSWIIDDILSIYHTGVHHSLCLDNAEINAYNPSSIHSMNLFTRKYPYVKKFIDKYIHCYLLHPYKYSTIAENMSNDRNLDWILSSLAFYFDEKYSAVDEKKEYTILDKAEYLLPIICPDKMAINEIEDKVYLFNPFIKYFSN